MTEDTTKRALSAADILSAEDLEVKEIHVPEWKGSVCLRVLPADVGLELDAKMKALTKENEPDALFILLGACLCDKSGAPLFADEAQRAKLRSRSQKVLLRLQQEALRLQGWLPGEPSVKNG